MLHSVGNGKYVCEGVLCHAVGAVGRNVGDNDVAVFCCLGVNHVVASGEDSNILKIWQFPYYLSAHHHLVGENDVGIDTVLIHFFFSGAWIYSHVAKFL